MFNAGDRVVTPIRDPIEYAASGNHRVTHWRDRPVIGTVESRGRGPVVDSLGHYCVRVSRDHVVFAYEAELTRAETSGLVGVAGPVGVMAVTEV